MTSVTISVPEETHNLMRRFPEVNWSALVRKSIIEKVARLRLREELFKQLEKEQEITDWAVRIVRQGRKR